MDNTCWIPIILLFFFVIKTYLDSSKTEDKMEIEGREQGDTFRIEILGNKTYNGWITFRNHLDIRGHRGGKNILLVALGLNEVFSEEIRYSEIKNININRANGASNGSNIINIEFERKSRINLIQIIATTDSDTFTIKNTILEHIKEYERKIEIQRMLRLRYQSGDFKEISPSNFEKVIGELFTFMGYSVARVGGSGDGGVDLRCHNYSTGEKVIVQCKRYSGKVGVGVIRDFYGTLIHSKSNKGYVVTTNTFTKEAQIWIRDKPIELVDGDKLSQLMMQYYK